MMKVVVRTKEVEPKADKPKALRVNLVFDPETAYQLSELALREGVEVAEVVRTLVVGGLSAYPKWGIEASDRRRGFLEQQRAILANLYAWFNEQRWIMEQQIAETERDRSEGEST